MNYVYDGTYVGFLCCVFEGFERKEQVTKIGVDGQFQSNIFEEQRSIYSDSTKAKRVIKGMETKLGKTTAGDFYRVFLSEQPAAIQSAFNLLIKLFKGQTNALNNYGDADALNMAQTLKKVSRERHRMKAFIRFEKATDGLYFSIIEPDFNVLPLIVTFFKNRYADQRWLIYDVKRKYGMMYDLQSVTEVTLTDTAHLQTDITSIGLDETDELYQTLWKRYYNSTNIKERKNMKLHLQHVPKRYWKYLTEKN
jgi:probable DNA metabolism protein